MLLNPALLNQFAHNLVYFMNGEIDLNLTFIIACTRGGWNIYSGNNTDQYLPELTPFD
jgi:hypothetical protein